MTDTQELIGLYIAMAGDIGDPLPEDEWTQGLGFFIRTYNFLRKKGRVCEWDERLLIAYHAMLTTVDAARARIGSAAVLSSDAGVIRGLNKAEEILFGLRGDLERHELRPKETKGQDDDQAK